MAVAATDAEAQVVPGSGPERDVRRVRGVTIVETIAGLLLILILGVVAIPRIASNPAAERESACKVALGLVRSSIANHYARTAREAPVARYPSLPELLEPGRVLPSPLPANPYNGSREVQELLWHADRPPVRSPDTIGWNYDPQTGRFWPNALDHHANRW